jgi:DNA-binding LacI/PurR family transcriptional regulator
MAITLKDVAKEVGLSITAVSDVLRNDPKTRIAPDTKIRILETAQRMGYRHNIHARTLSTGKSKLIGIIAHSLNGEVLLSEIEAMDNIIREKGYRTILRVLGDNPDTQKEILNELLSNRIEGLICVLGASWSPDILAAILYNNIPVAAIGPVVGLDIDYVNVDRLQGSYLAVKHLLELGHKRIAIMIRDLETYFSQQRLLGYKKALDEYEIPLDESLIIKMKEIDGKEHTMGYTYGKTFLSSNSEATAVYAYTDHVAFGLMKAAKELGIEIPKDMAVVGFDNNELSPYAPSPLATVAQPIEVLAETATSLIFKRINKETGLKQQIITIEPKLIIRESSGNKKNI